MPSSTQNPHQKTPLKKIPFLQDGIILVVLIAVYCFFKYANPFGVWDSAAVVWFQEQIYWSLLKMLRENFTNPIFYIGVGFIVLLEKVFPAKPKQRVFSVSLAHDFVWFCLRTLFEVNFVFIYVKWLKYIYVQYFSFLTIEAIGLLPEAVRFIWGMLLTDFLAWLHHWVKHRFTWIWEFHKIHHSQREMNLFTDLRTHIFEFVISRPIVTFPMMMFAVDIPKIILFNILYMWYPRLYHANIKLNLGPLRHILVTPQSHRIHHSIEREHFDKNYGVLFTFWDKMFRTHYYGCEEYPDTGIKDEAFPHERTLTGFSLILTPLAQLAYPFIAIGRRIFRKKNK